MIAAVLAGPMAALLFFSINYLVNQVVLGVVLNLLASGSPVPLRQLGAPASINNSAPVLEPMPIPGLARSRSSVFEQNILAYLAGSVALVWVVLYRTTWGLRIRATGEHPEAADTVGISVRGIRWSAVLAGGVFGGLGLSSHWPRPARSPRSSPLATASSPSRR